MAHVRELCLAAAATPRAVEPRRERVRAWACAREREELERVGGGGGGGVVGGDVSIKSSSPSSSSNPAGSFILASVVAL